MNALEASGRCRKEPQKPLLRSPPDGTGALWEISGALAAIQVDVCVINRLYNVLL